MSWFLAEGDGLLIAFGFETERMVSILLRKGDVPLKQKESPYSSFIIRQLDSQSVQALQTTFEVQSVHEREGMQPR